VIKVTFWRNFVYSLFRQNKPKARSGLH